MKSTSAIHPVITENTEDTLMKCVPISQCVKASISAMCNSFHNIRAVECVKRLCNIKILCLTLKPLCANCKLSPICSCEERMGAQGGSKVVP